MPLRAKKMCGAAGVNSSSHVSGAKAKSLHERQHLNGIWLSFSVPKRFFPPETSSLNLKCHPYTGNVIPGKKRVKFKPFSNHNRSLLKQQP